MLNACIHGLHGTVDIIPSQSLSTKDRARELFSRGSGWLREGEPQIGRIYILSAPVVAYDQHQSNTKQDR